VSGVAVASIHFPSVAEYRLSRFAETSATRAEYRTIFGEFEMFDASFVEANRIGLAAAIRIAGRIVDLHLIETRR
jgi:hypothetical protein